MLVTDYLLFVVGCLILCTGCWLMGFDVGRWLLVVYCWVPSITNVVVVTVVDDC